MVCTDTPQQMRSVFDLVTRTLKQLFWQPDVCHSVSLSICQVSQIPAVKE